MTGKVQAIFKRGSDGAMLAIRNWRHRSQEADALVAVPLTDGEVELLERMRAEGISDDAIFDRLYRETRPPRPTIPIDQLTQDQLCLLLRQMAGHPLESVDRMEKVDQIALLRSMCRRGDDWQADLI